MANAAQSPMIDAMKKSFTAPFGAVLQLTSNDGESVWIDGRKTPPAVTSAPPTGAEPACAWRGARDSLIRAIVNNRAFESAYVSGRIAVSGDMSVMARLELGVHK